MGLSDGSKKEEAISGLWVTTVRAAVVVLAVGATVYIISHLLAILELGDTFQQLRLFSQILLLSATIFLTIFLYKVGKFLEAIVGTAVSVAISVRTWQMIGIGMEETLSAPLLFSATVVTALALVIVFRAGHQTFSLGFGGMTIGLLLFVWGGVFRGPAIVQLLGVVVGLLSLSILVVGASAQAAKLLQRGVS